jgi:hypothetical protein
MGARLPETEPELRAFAAAARAAADCIRPDSSPDALAADARRWVAGLQGWWETRNKRGGGEGGRENTHVGGRLQFCSEQGDVIWECCCLVARFCNDRGGGAGTRWGGLVGGGGSDRAHHCLSKRPPPLLLSRRAAGGQKRPASAAAASPHAKQSRRQQGG